MAIAKAYTAQLSGLDLEKITVEVDISNGLHSFSVVGLGDRSVEEAKDRIGAAIKNIGYISPKQKNQKVVISLAPAHIRKEGSGFDLAMAMAYLVGAGDIEFEFENILFLGELSLEGSVRKAYGVLPVPRSIVEEVSPVIALLVKVKEAMALVKKSKLRNIARAMYDFCLDIT